MSFEPKIWRQISPARKLILTLAFAGSIYASAGTTVAPVPFAQMVEKADLIMEGTVVSSRCESRLRGTNEVVFTLVEIEQQDTVKGKAAKTITLQCLGGSVGSNTLEVIGVPKFKKRDRVVLFIQKNGIQFCPIVGLYQGKFNLRTDPATGRDFLEMHNGQPLRNVNEIGVRAESSQFFRSSTIGSPLAAPMSLVTFKEEIRLQMARQKSSQ